MDTLNLFSLVSAIYDDCSSLVNINSVDPAIPLIVSFQVFSQRLILLIGHILFNFDDDESPHRSDTILRILRYLFFGEALKSIALVRS